MILVFWLFFGLESTTRVKSMNYFIFYNFNTYFNYFRSPGPEHASLADVSSVVSPSQASVRLPFAVLSYVRMTLHRHTELLMAVAQSR